MGATGSRGARLALKSGLTSSPRLGAVRADGLAERCPQRHGCCVPLDLDLLIADMDAIAIATWERVSLGPGMGMSLREDGITDENLFRLARDHPALVCRKFTSREEPLNGADWEWWIGSDDEGWIALRIQAKKLAAMRYDELRYRAASQERVQCRVLVEQTESDADGKAVYPFYCFYNGWEEPEGWPPDVPWTVGCAKPANCKTVPDVRIFGCALAPANDVLQVIDSSPTSLEASEVLPLQRPWSWIFAEMGHSKAADLAGIHENVQRQRGGRELGQPVAELPRYASAVRERWDPDSLRELARLVPTSYVTVTDLADDSDRDA